MFFIKKNGQHRYKYLVLGRDRSYFVKHHSDSTKKFSETDIFNMLENFMVAIMTWLTFSYSRLITGFVTRLTWWVPLVEQELLTLPEHLSSPPVFSMVRVTRSLVLYVCFVDRCLSFCTFSFGHCVVCSSSIYRFWLPIWYL